MRIARRWGGPAIFCQITPKQIATRLSPLLWLGLVDPFRGRLEALRRLSRRPWAWGLASLRPPPCAASGSARRSCGSCRCAPTSGTRRATPPRALRRHPVVIVERPRLLVFVGVPSSRPRGLHEALHEEGHRSFASATASPPSRTPPRPSPTPPIRTPLLIAPSRYLVLVFARRHHRRRRRRRRRRDRPPAPSSPASAAAAASSSRDSSRNCVISLS